MVNEIKLDGITTAQPVKQSPRETTTPTQATTLEGVTITNQLGSFIKTLVADNDVPNNQRRIAELKHQIETNQYHIDMDALSSKLAHVLLPSKLGT